MDFPSVLNLPDMAAAAANSLCSTLPPELRAPAVAIICGTGLSELVDTLDPSPRCQIDYKDIPNFAQSTVSGHAGKLAFGILGRTKTPVVLMLGRLHFYEGYSMETITFPIRVFRLLGVHTLLVTNAAGGLNPNYAVGDLVILSDHLNLAGLMGNSPLRGPADGLGPRFLALSDAYDLELRSLTHQAWARIARGRSLRNLQEGVYAYVGGPSYETRAECRMLRSLGADLVGMSTVPEIIVARHCGIRVLALSLVTNQAVCTPGPRGDDIAVVEAPRTKTLMSLSDGRANHEEVLEAAKDATKDMQNLVMCIVEDLVSKIEIERATSDSSASGPVT